MLFVNNNINEVVNGGNILAAIGGNLNTNNLTLELLNEGGEIGTGGIVSLVGAGEIHANCLLAQIDNREGGGIGDGGVIGMDVAGNASIANDATIAFCGSVVAAAGAMVIHDGMLGVGGRVLCH